LIKVFGKDLVRYFPAQAVPNFLALISVPLFTRMLSPEQFGQYILVKTSVQVMVVLTSWLRPAIIRFYPSVPERKVLLRTSFWTQVALTCGAAAFAFALNHTFWKAERAIQSLLDIGILLFILESFSYLFAQTLRARMQVNTYSLFVVWEETVGLGLGVLLVTVGQLGVAGILWGSLLGTATVLPFLGRVVLKDTPLVGPVSFPLLRELASYGVPLTMAQFMAWAVNYSDRYQIKLFYSAAEVGMYAAAYAVAHHSITFLSSLFRLSSGPLLFNIWESRGQEASMKLLNSVTRLYLLVTIPMVIGMSVLAKPMMQIFAGANFGGSHTVVPWVVAGAFFLGLEHRFNHVLLFQKHTRVVMLSLIASSLLNVTMNWFLLPLFDYRIAAVTTLISYIFLCVTQALASRRYIHWPFPWQTVIRSLSAAALMGVVIYWFVNAVSFPPLWTALVAVPAGVLIYSCCIWIFGEISSVERQALGIHGRRWLAQKLERSSGS
jgi:O-antigen/teichoic acid export membrane protein